MSTAQLRAVTRNSDVNTFRLLHRIWENASLQSRSVRLSSYSWVPLCLCVPWWYGKKLRRRYLAGEQKPKPWKCEIVLIQCICNRIPVTRVGDASVAVKTSTWKEKDAFGKVLGIFCAAKVWMIIWFWISWCFCRCPSQSGMLIVLGVSFLLALALGVLSSKNCNFVH